MTGVLISIQIGLPKTYAYAGGEDGQPKKWRTGIYKLPVSTPVSVGRLGIDGDGQENLKYHGGPDRPILAYSAEHYPLWQSELNLPEMKPGGFGENFTISSDAGVMNESTVCIGDRFDVGEIELEVSQPREPCFKLQRRWGHPELSDRVLKYNRGGWYLRVIRGGTVAAGAIVRRTANPHPQWTIAEAMRVLYHGKDDLAASRSLFECSALSERWRLLMGARLA